MCSTSSRVLPGGGRGSALARVHAETIILFLDLTDTQETLLF
jgi:hypothetical protein